MGNLNQRQIVLTVLLDDTTLVQGWVDDIHAVYQKNDRAVKTYMVIPIDKRNIDGMHISVPIDIIDTTWLHTIHTISLSIPISN